MTKIRIEDELEARVEAASHGSRGYVALYRYDARAHLVVILTIRS